MPSDLEVLRVLAKHAHVQADPDDQQLISDFLEETAESESKTAATSSPKKGAV